MSDAKDDLADNKADIAELKSQTGGLPVLAGRVDQLEIDFQWPACQNIRCRRPTGHTGSRINPA